MGLIKEIPTDLDKLLLNVLDVSADGILMVNSRHEIIYANQSLLDIFGYKSKQLIGQPLHLLLPERFKGRHAKHVEGFKKGVEVTKHMFNRQDVCGMRKDKSEFPLQVAISKVEFEGQIVMTAILRDVSEERTREKVEKLVGEVAKATNESSNVKDALIKSLKIVCETLDWSLGQVFIGQNDTLVDPGIYYAEDRSAKSFATRSLGKVFQPGEGRVGAVYKLAAPAWVSNITKDQMYLRKNDAKKFGIISMAAFPIMVGDDAVGVMSFFSKKPYQGDKKLMEVMELVGIQLGRIFERAEAEETLKEANRRITGVLETIMDDSKPSRGDIKWF